MDKIFKIELTDQELNTVLTALNELPIKVGLQTLQKVVQQAQQQANTPQEAVSDVTAKE